jgi:16S rRNA (uracil1498-N3)-methyltransferase
MRIPRIYTPGHLALGTLAELDDAASHYISRVLRLGVSQSVTLFNGQGGEFSGRICTLGKRVSVQLEAFNPEDRESPLGTHLLIGLSRGERFDWVLQKATELGVSEITPLFTERCEVKLHGDRADKKSAHWFGIVQSACEQCQRNRLPLLHPPARLETVLPSITSDLKLVLHHRAQAPLNTVDTPQHCALLIGPEGGLSEHEIATAEASGFRAWQLGPRVLRTETAPIAALSLLQFTFGDYDRVI